MSVVLWSPVKVSAQSPLFAPGHNEDMHRANSDIDPPSESTFLLLTSLRESLPCIDATHDIALPTWLLYLPLHTASGNYSREPCCMSVHHVLFCSEDDISFLIDGTRIIAVYWCRPVSSLLGRPRDDGGLHEAVEPRKWMELYNHTFESILGVIYFTTYPFVVSLLLSGGCP